MLRHIISEMQMSDRLFGFFRIREAPARPLFWAERDF